MGVDALARASAPEEEGGRGSTLDKNAKRRIVLVQSQHSHDSDAFTCRACLCKLRCALPAKYD